MGLVRNDPVLAAFELMDAVLEAKVQEFVRKAVDLENQGHLEVAMRLRSRALGLDDALDLLDDEKERYLNGRAQQG